MRAVLRKVRLATVAGLAGLPWLVLSAVLLAPARAEEPPEPPRGDDNPQIFVPDDVVPPLFADSLIPLCEPVGGVLSSSWLGPLHVLPWVYLPENTAPYSIFDIVDGRGLPVLPENLDDTQNRFEKAKREYEQAVQELEKAQQELSKERDNKEKVEKVRQAAAKADQKKVAAVKALRELRQSDRDFGEFLAYCDALDKAYRYKARTFENSAHRDLSQANLLLQPSKHRGEVVFIEGILKRVRRFDPPLMASQAGVRDVYEGWVFDPKSGPSFPVCIVFPELPPGLSVGERLNQPVTFAGYFFKKYRYVAGDKTDHDVPLLIGNSPVLVHEAAAAGAAEGTSWNGPLLAGFVAVSGCIVLLVLGMHFWYRRNDQRVQSRLAATTRGQFVPPAAELDLPPPGPRAPNGDDTNPFSLS
jgi:hypothetical protein